MVSKLQIRGRFSRFAPVARMTSAPHLSFDQSDHQIELIREHSELKFHSPRRGQCCCHPFTRKHCGIRHRQNGQDLVLVLQPASPPLPSPPPATKMRSPKDNKVAVNQGM